MTKEQITAIDKEARDISFLINSLCNEDAVLTKEYLLNRMYNCGISYPDKLLMPLRKKGIITVSRGKNKTDKALYSFKKRPQPIFYKEFESILIQLCNKKRKSALKIKAIKVKSVQSYLYWTSTCTINCEAIYTYVR